MSLALKLGACAAAGAATYFACITQHTFTLDSTKQRVTRYRVDKEVIVPKRIMKRINSVMEDLKLPQEIRDRIKVFEVAGFELFIMGLVSSKYGVIFGIPPNYGYKNVEAIPNEYIKLFGVPIDWNREESKEFLKSLVIPKRAQKGAMAYVLLRMQMDEPQYKAILTGTWVTGTLAIHQVFKTKVKNRMLFAITLFAGSILGWLHAKDYMYRSFERKCDQRMLTLGPEYVIGYKEYLDILANRCLASRSVMEDYGKTLFKENGDRKYWLLRTESIPLSQRREFFKSKVMELGFS